jgi:uncharacterized membrane protein YdbT with pleckstrin-like domain
MGSSPAERVCWESRLHEVVLAAPLGRALAIASCGLLCVVVGWPLSLAAPPLLAAGAVVALAAVWRWERTQLVVTSEQLVVLQGTLRRRTAAVDLSHLGLIEVEQTMIGRLLGYGTLVADDLEIDYAPEPRRLSALVTHLAGDYPA